MITIPPAMKDVKRDRGHPCACFITAGLYVINKNEIKTIFSDIEAVIC